MIDVDNFKKIEEILLTIPKFVSNDNKLLKNKVYESAMKLDEELLNILVKNVETKEIFFKELENILVFDKQNFLWVLNSNKFIPDSFTSFAQDIGLTNQNREFLIDNNNVVLSFPYKDSLVEFDSTDDKEERDEIFYHESIDKQNIETLTESKLLSDPIRHFSDREENEIEFDDDNLLIKGNNLFALHSLLPRYNKKIKLMYWDILFNTSNDNVPYKDSFKHSTWLTMMKNRLEVAKELLHEEGLIFVHCDKNEDSYLKVLMDEIFNRDHYVTTLAVKSNSISGPKTAHKEKTILKNKDSILVYSKSINFKINPQYIEKEDWDTHYNKFLEGDSGDYTIRSLKKVLVERDVIDSKTPMTKLDVKNKKFMRFYLENQDKIYREVNSISKDLKELSLENTNEIVSLDGHLAINGKRINFLSRSIHEVQGNERTAQLLGDLWTDIDFQNTQNEGGEGVSLPSGQKPERLLRRIIEMASEEGDIVLDAYSGTATTAAVALKTNRKFIAIEQLDTHYEMGLQRLKNVLDGEESGISKIVSWDPPKYLSFVSISLKESSSKIVDEIIKMDKPNKLVEMYKKLYHNSFISYRVDFDKLKEGLKTFEKFDINEQKQFLISILEKNYLYVNYLDYKDENLNIDKDDIKFSKSFYKK